MSIDYSDMKFAKPVWKKKEKLRPRQKKVKTVPVQQKKRSKRKHKKRKSIMQPKTDRRCYLCMLRDSNYCEHAILEEHHVLFGNTKNISDEYGLRVNLCIPHHRTGKAAVHNNADNAKLLMKIAQQRFNEEFPDENWMEIVKENYL